MGALYHLSTPVVAILIGYIYAIPGYMNPIFKGDILRDIVYK